MKSRFQLASAIAHELGHAKQALSRGFTVPEAAPFLKASDYVILRWLSEFEAFRVQYQALKEIADSNAALKVCVDGVVTDDARLKFIKRNDFEQARRELAADYEESQLESEHSQYKNVSADELKALADVKSAVEKFLSTQEWSTGAATWAAYLTVE